jgi:DNA replication and repair protein RecF
MLLRQIALNHFRNFGKVDFTFNPLLTVIIGPNARGKTNLLEAIYFITNGYGFRESKEEELINLEANDCFVEGNFVLAEDSFNFRINLVKNRRPEGDRPSVEKVYFINNTKQKYSQYLKEQTKAILFSPEQIAIITNSPDARRDYFNRLLSGYDWEYKKRLGNLENALRRRNKILESVYDEQKLLEELAFWDDYLENQANYITKKREEYIDYLNQHPELEEKEFRIEYVKNILTKERFLEVFEQEKRWHRTLIGPQKDDFQVYLKNKHDKNIHHFGSRSEQRLAIMWLKINEVKYYEENFKHKPILLLDDIFSELDAHNKKLVLNLVKKYQTVSTTTEKEVIPLIEVPQTIIKL